MRRSFKQYLTVALGLSVLTPSAHAQLADNNSVKPVVMLLVDTSGSMERMPDTSTCTSCLPSCTNSATDVNNKNRWTITVEALTGSFNNSYRCISRTRSTQYPGQYDADYFLPHYEISGTQATDGVMDNYLNLVKFGLMTFDGISTTVNGATLVPWSQYSSDATFKAQILGQAGMWSYPDAVAPILTDATLDTPKDAYGWKPLSFPGCLSVYGVNAGARGKLDPVAYPGSLVSVGASDSGSSINGVNSTIQTSLLNVRPYGGTPIAGMLDDLRYYLNNDTDVANGSDLYYACRKRFAILLTDGAPDTLFRGDPRFSCESKNGAQCYGGVCQCPYDTEENLASKLVSNDGLTKLFVAAFNVNDAAAITKLNNIANAGRKIGEGTQTAAKATNLAELRSALDAALSTTRPTPTSRSTPVVVNTGTAIQLGGQQFNISAGFVVGQKVTDPWQGRLYRQRIGCDGANPSEQAIDDTKDTFHKLLNAQTTRNLYTVYPTLGPLGSTTGSLFAYSNSPAITTPTPNKIWPDGTVYNGTYTVSDSTYVASQATSDWGLTGLSLSNLDTSTNSLYFGDADGDGLSGTASDRNRISNFLRATSAAADRYQVAALGDIYHSNPTVQLPIYANADQTQVSDPQLRGYYNDLLTTGSTVYPKGNYLPQIGYGRPGMLYVGTNDAILHAFNLDDWYDKNAQKWTAGYEFWGFVPPALFGKLATIASPVHTWGFDGTPIIKDMITVRTAAGVTTMKTILLAPVRGAAAYVALDVTFPEAPKFLWQRSFGYLGTTVAAPALAEVQVQWGATAEVQTRAVAILPGGSGSLSSGQCNVNQMGRGTAPNSRSKVPCWNLQGRQLDVVDVETGAIIQEFDSRHFHSPMTGSVAVDGVDVAQTRAAYMTDQDGILWRLSMYQADPSKWRVQPIWDLFADQGRNFSDQLVSADTAAKLYAAGRPAPYPPLLARDPATGTMTIVVATGDVDNLSDSNPNRVVSLQEIRNKSGTELDAATTSNMKANWTLQLDAGEAVTGAPVMLDDAVYFATFTGPAGGQGNVCTIGRSRLVAGAVRANDPNNTGLPLPKLTPASGSGPLVLQYQVSDSTGELVLGLSLSRAPVCIPGTVGGAGYNPLLAGTGRVTPSGGSTAAGGGAYQMRAMVGMGPGAATVGGPFSTLNGSDGQTVMKITMPITNVSRSVGWASSIE